MNKHRMLITIAIFFSFLAPCLTYADPDVTGQMNHIIQLQKNADAAVDNFLRTSEEYYADEALQINDNIIQQNLEFLRMISEVISNMKTINGISAANRLSRDAIGFNDLARKAVCERRNRIAKGYAAMRRTDRAWALYTDTIIRFDPADAGRCVREADVALRNIGGR